MSVVDRRVWLAGDVVRRLLPRALVVLGGAFAVTTCCWLLGAGSANADVLPQVPSIPQVLGAITPQLSTKDIPAAPSLPCSCLDSVTKQVHVAVSGVDDKAAPAIAPATALARHAVPRAPRLTPGSALVLAKPAKAPQIAVPLVRHHRGFMAPPAARHPVPGTRQHDRPRPARHSNPLPPLQPAGSSDSSAHGPGGVASGSGGAHIVVPHLADASRYVAGASGTPRLVAAGGQQPGTSPD